METIKDTSNCNGVEKVDLLQTDSVQPIERQVYVGVEFTAGYLDDDLVWVKSSDFVVEGQWLNLYDIIGTCRVTAGMMGERRTMGLTVTALRIPISSTRTIISTTTNPLEA